MATTRKRPVRRAAVRRTRRAGVGRVAAASSTSDVLAKLRERAEAARDAAQEKVKHLAQAAQSAAKGVDVKAIRKQLKLTPARFAALLGVSLAVVKLWERSRKPKNPAVAFLKKAKKRGRSLLA